MHMQCLQHWQALLHATKGVAAARRCDVCKERWAKCYQPPAVPTDWRTMLRDPFRSVPWPPVLEHWKFSVLATGALQGVRAGVQGFRCGHAVGGWGSEAESGGAGTLGARNALAAGTVPPLKAPIALCLVAFCGRAGSSGGAHVCGVRLGRQHGGLCLWSGGMPAGHAACGSLPEAPRRVLRLVALCPVAASALASGAGRLTASVGSLATKVVMALLKALAFTRLFA
ncbi:hypothetical protein COHA_009474 [Chlorella ohadii]|uniref:Uncharacterized protein n=1 Tax=Chlorella ohadii TaxID=2649997 RepID=A0AAD5DI06_9CHLO|nr:hypothetical protein COHA_009474 [Chlorella ohadii]